MNEAARTMFDPLTEHDREAAPELNMSSPEPQPIVPVPSDAPACSFHHRDYGGASRTWEYRAGDGSLWGYVARWDVSGAKGQRRKEIRPFSYCSLGDGRQGWRIKGLPDPRPLYRLPEIAQRPDAVVLVTEGERAVDAADELFPDLVATTPPHVSKSPGKADWSALAGRRVLIWPDYDQPGLEFAETVVKLASEAGAEVSVVHVPERFPAKWDLADDLPEGWSLPDLRQLIDDAPRASGDQVPRTASDFLSGLPTRRSRCPRRTRTAPSNGSRLLAPGGDR